MAAPGSRRAVLLSDELQCTQEPGFLCAYLCSISLLICQASLQQLSRTLSGTNAWQLRPETSSCCHLSHCCLHGPAGRGTGSWRVPHPLGRDPTGLGTSHQHPHAAGTDLTRRWAGKPRSRLPGLPGGQKHEPWQGHRACYFPGTCGPWGIVLPAGISSLPTSHGSSFPGLWALKIEQKRPQISFGFALGSRVWPQTCSREPLCPLPSQAGGTPSPWRTGVECCS